MNAFQLVGEDADDVDFGNMILTCVYCSAQRPLRSMIPFARARFRRRRWITALSEGDAQSEAYGFLFGQLCSLFYEQ